MMTTPFMWTSAPFYVNPHNQYLLLVWGSLRSIPCPPLVNDLWLIGHQTTVRFTPAVYKYLLQQDHTLDDLKIEDPSLHMWAVPLSSLPFNPQSPPLPFFPPSFRLLSTLPFLPPSFPFHFLSIFHFLFPLSFLSFPCPLHLSSPFIPFPSPVPPLSNLWIASWVQVGHITTEIKYLIQTSTVCYQCRYF